MRENTRIPEIAPSPKMDGIEAFVQSFRDIRAGEEILFSYSAGYWGTRFFSQISKRIDSCIPVLLWDYFYTSLSKTHWSSIKVTLTNMKPDYTEDFLLRALELDCLETMAEIDQERPIEEQGDRPSLTCKLLKIAEQATTIRDCFDQEFPEPPSASPASNRELLRPFQDYYFGRELYAPS